MPDNFELTLERRRDAVLNGLPPEEVDEAFAEFRRYWHSDGRAKHNWDGMWGNRCRELSKRQRYASKSAQNYSPVS